MRLAVFSYVPVTASLTGFASNATGASWPLTATAATDGLAHAVTVRNDTANDHSGKTITIVGTDADGHALTETIAGPAGSATVTSTKRFKTVTSVTPSATIGADTVDIGWDAVSVTPTYPIDRHSASGSLVFADISGTINYSGEETFQEIYGETVDPGADEVTWNAMSGMSAKTADTASSTTVGATAVRVKVNTVTNGATLKISYIQPDVGA